MLLSAVETYCNVLSTMSAPEFCLCLFSHGQTDSSCYQNVVNEISDILIIGKNVLRGHSTNTTKLMMISEKKHDARRCGYFSLFCYNRNL